MSNAIGPAKKVLYIIVCGAPGAAHVGDLVELAQQQWDIYVIATPQGAEFLDEVQLEQLTDHPVTSEYRSPDEPKRYPDPDAIIVAPATFNTINKWAQGIADTPVVAILCEHMARKIPIAVYPMLKNELAQHPAYKQSLKVLKASGIQFHRRQSGVLANGHYRWPDVLLMIQSEQDSSSHGSA